MRAWEPRRRWAARLSAGGTPPRRAWDLLEALGPDGLASASAAEWAEAVSVPLEHAAGWRERSLAFDPVREEERAGALGARLIARGDPEYPDLLASIHDPPLVLYAVGTFADRPPVAVVGSRTPTPYGLRAARRLAGDAARAGVAIVSGLARGIDAAAHLAALEAKAPTWAVLASGLGQVYPPENRGLARRIAAEGGVLVSEMPVDTPPARELFPRRNRVVSGLAWATAVIEGRGKSGSSITANCAAEQGREVLALPGPYDSPLSETPHRLLRQGARLLSGVEDLLAVLPEGQLRTAYEAPPAPARPSPPPTGEEASVLALLGSDALSLDELVQLSGLDTHRISSIMFGLELKERVYSVPGQRYAQKEARR